MTSKTVYKMFQVFCNVKFCIFCTFLYVYGLYHILLSCDKIMDPWNVCMYVCMYVCMACDILLMKALWCYSLQK
jgi:hypothetical protein